MRRGRGPNRLWGEFAGRTYGRLRVLAVVKAGARYVFECVCTCGNTRTAWSYNVLKGKTRSCGCLQRERSRTCNRGRRRGRGDRQVARHVELSMYRLEPHEVAINKVLYRMRFKYAVAAFIRETGYGLADIARRVGCMVEFLDEALNGFRPLNSGLAQRTAEAMWDLVNEPRGS